MQHWTERLEDDLFQKSRHMAPPWGPIVRALRFPAAIGRDWLAGEINVRAMSLAYTTLLSLVPLMVFSFSILKAVGAHGELRYLLHQFFRPLGASANQLTETVMQFVANMRGDVLGFLGFGFLVYTVITTMQKVEAGFNFVWRVEQRRNFARRFIEYLGVMIVGPVLLAVAFGLMGTAAHSPLAQWLNAIPPIAWLMALLGELVPYSIVTLVFTFMYAFIPNMHVQFRAALLGGVTAGIIWALVGKVYTEVILYSSQLMVVYTGFAIVLTTLIWVYLSWLILLIGAQLAFYLQFPQYLRHGHASVELTGFAREQAGLSVMCLIAADYARDGMADAIPGATKDAAHVARHGVTQGAPPWTAAALAAALDIPTTALGPVLACLERGGLIVATAKGRYLPARDLGGIRLIDIIDAVRTRQPGRLMVNLHSVAAAARVMQEVESAIEAKLGDQSLKDLIAAT
jgi:membrane protein